jgi:hypothetical protein
VAKIFPFNEVFSVLKGAFVGGRNYERLNFCILGFEFRGKKVKTI